MTRLLFALLLAAPLVAQRGETTVRFENYYSFRHPVAWSYSAGNDNGLLSPPALSANDDDQRGELMLMFTYVTDVRDPRNSSEVARITGAIPPVIEKRSLGASSVNHADGGGWAHTWEILDDGVVDSMIRIYVLPLRRGGAAVVISTGAPQAFQTWRGSIDRIVASVSSQLSQEGSRSAASPKPSAAPDAAAAAPVGAPVAPPAPGLGPEARARLLEEWRSRLAGKAWTSPRKTYRLGAGGEFEYEAVTLIAGLDDSAASKTADRGVWRIVVDAARAHLELESAAGRKWRVRCDLRDNAILLDGDPVQAAVQLP